MNVLYISIAFPKESEGSNLYTDLAETISKNNKVTVLVADGSDSDEKVQINQERGIEVVRTKVKRMYGVSLIEKAFSYLSLPYKMNKTIKKYLSDREYDMILYTAPPVTIEKIVKYAKSKFKCMSYLMQKDIFPQNAVDIGIMKKYSLIYWYFRSKEKKLFKVSDKIGCMSQGNKEYIANHNSKIKGIEEKTEIFPNTIMLREDIKQYDMEKIKEKYNIPNDKIIALYGGNFGKPQGIDFILKVIKYYENNNKLFWLFSGKGTEKERLYEYIKQNNIKNILMLDYMPKADYDNILKIADIGLIFLDSRFTIPNIPSRMLSYLEYSIPILAATDQNTDLQQILEKNNIGLWCESKEIDDFVKKMNYYIENPQERINIGSNGREYLENQLTTEDSVKILKKAYNDFIKEDNKNV